MGRSQTDGRTLWLRVWFWSLHSLNSAIFFTQGTHVFKPQKTKMRTPDPPKHLPPRQYKPKNAMFDLRVILGANMECLGRKKIGSVYFNGWANFRRDMARETMVAEFRWWGWGAKFGGGAGIVRWFGEFVIRPNILVRPSGNRKYRVKSSIGIDSRKKRTWREKWQSSLPGIDTEHWAPH